MIANTIRYALSAVFLGSSALAANPLQAPPLDPSVPKKLNLPKDFKPKGNLPSRGMHIRRMAGAELPERNGIHPIYLTAALPNLLPYKPLLKGDVVLAVNGKPLGKNALRQFSQVAAAASKGPGVFWVTRWRDGEVSRHLVDLGTRAQDLTQGGLHNPDQEDWNLGATGAEGWTWSVPHKTTEGATQIYVTQVRSGSPADGVLKIGDVILGVNGRKFEIDARKEFGRALSIAEGPEMDGKLKLTVWRSGKTSELTIPMQVMGSYSPTAPGNCPKTQRIIDQACAHLLKNAAKEKQGIVRHVNALAMLATGRKEFMPMLKEHAAKVVENSKGVSNQLGVNIWGIGYGNMFLCEYYLATGDQSVLPGILEYTLALARGQSDVGSWGHRTCEPYDFEGGPVFGIAPGYGALNNCALSAMVSMTLAQKCGVTDPKVTLATKRGADFFRYYTGKGTIPYGDHPPGTGDHEDNGKNAIAAVMFDLLGDKQAATYFSHMSVASFNARENGHTGNYFNFLWGALAAARSGDAALTAYMQRLQWFFDMERREDGSFFYQGKPGMAKTGNGEHAYKGWDCTSARLLAYCLPMRKLHITGKGGGAVTALQGKALTKAASAGDVTEKACQKMTSQQLLATLSSWSPVARQRAANELAKRKEDHTGILLKMLNSGDRYSQYGACLGLSVAGRAEEKVAKALINAALKSDDLVLVLSGLQAFRGKTDGSGLTKVAPLALPTILKIAGAKHADDPVQRIQYECAFVLFSHGRGKKPLLDPESMKTVDQDLFVSSIRALLLSPNGNARTMTSNVYKQLDEATRNKLWPDIEKATKELAPSGIMFAGGVRIQGLRLLMDQRSKEGLELAPYVIRNGKFHGAQGRIKTILDLIVKHYGSHAKSIIPRLLEVANYYEHEMDNPHKAIRKEIAEMIRNTVKQIEKSPPAKGELKSLGL